jgi:peptide/nickel transport system substrate-binding protein
MDSGLTRRGVLVGALPAATFAGSGIARAAGLKGGTLRIALLTDIVNYDPLQFSSNNMPLIKNLYDALVEYAPDGSVVPWLASAWSIAPDHASIKLTLRDGVTFHSGAPVTTAAVVASFTKASDPKKGKNAYPTMSIVKDWTVIDPKTITLNFKGPVPDRQITDLLQFMAVIDPAIVEDVETKVSGTGPFMLAERVLGQRFRMVKNPKYWHAGEPVLDEIVCTVFADNDAAAAALESGAVDAIYGGGGRAAVRLRDQGFQLFQGKGQLVQVLRINTTRGPFRNEKYRQAFNYLVDRAAILKVGYAGLGEVTALPWAPASPAADRSYDTKYAFNLDKGKELLKESGLSEAEMNDWKLLVNGSDEDAAKISQVVQSTLQKVGIQIGLEIKQGGEFVDALLGGKFAAVFGGVGNVQKFPSRLTTNSIYRTVKNPVLGDPLPFPAYVAAVERVNTSFGSDVKPAYDNLNKVLVESAFGIATNTFDVALMVASKKVGGFTPDIDSMLVGRTLGFTS